MKKLLSLLSVLTISVTAVPTTISASPYQKEETIKNSDINYRQTNNLKRNKREDNNITILECNNSYNSHSYGKYVTSKAKITISESEFNRIIQFIANNEQEKVKILINEWKEKLVKKKKIMFEVMANKKQLMH